MSITRVPVFRCTVQGCPWPKDAEMHRPWCLGIPSVQHDSTPTHQHWPKKGMGGKRKESRIVAILCPFCHDRIDNGNWGNSASYVPGKGLVYWAWKPSNGGAVPKTLIERVIEAVSSAAEAATNSGAYAEHRNAHGGSSAAPPSVSRAESAAEAGKLASEVDLTSKDALFDPSRVEPACNRGSSAAPSALAIPGTITETSLTLPQDLSFDDWSKGIKELSKFGHHYQFFLGDAIIFGEDRFGEEAWQTLDSLGLQPESIGNIVRVCRATPPEARHPKLKYSHHVVTYKLDAEERDTWLAAAEAGEWSVAEFRERVQGKPSRKKRWGLEELRHACNDWWEGVRKRGSHENVHEFLNWLQEQGE